jgi:hypothetical protein
MKLLSAVHAAGQSLLLQVFDAVLLKLGTAQLLASKNIKA